MNQFDLRDKFPEMQPIQSAPSMTTINGFGLMLYGQRDNDRETRSYVATHWICCLFIPFIAIGAYRVVNGGNNTYYFLGKVPLSTVVRMWNLFLLTSVLALSGIGYWNHHVSQPEYRAQQQLREARDAASLGELPLATRRYCDVYQFLTVHSTTATDELSELLATKVVEADPSVARQVFDAIADSLRQGNRGRLLDATLAAAEQLFARRHETHPADCLAIWELLRPVAKEDWQVAMRRGLLEKIVALEPGNIARLSQLTELLEAAEELERCETLLAPHADKLGDTEGARILGQRLVGKGDYAGAYRLLMPYAQQRLQRLHDANQSYEKQLERFQQEVLDELRKGLAGPSFYQRYDASTEDQQREMVNDYLVTRLKANARLQEEQNKLREQAKVVPVALDLGQLQLHRAQQTNDPAERKTELEAAEKTFLAVRGVAGESDTYRVTLGQVYYWLGKQEEGKALFEEFLAAKSREPAALLRVVLMLRQVGEVARARTLAEEAYDKATQEDLKFDIAETRSLLRIDNEDSIKWLQRTNPKSLDSRASLASARAHKAILEGDQARAIEQWGQAESLYKQMPETASTLNNYAVVLLARFSETRVPADFEAAVAKLRRAISLTPDDSVLISNTATLLVGHSIRGLIGDRLEVAEISRLEWGAAGFLYADAAGRLEWDERYKNHPGIQEANRLFDRLTLLAPKDPDSFHWLANHYRRTDNLPALRSLWERIQSAQFDTADDLATVLQATSEEKVQQQKQSLERELKRHSPEKLAQWKLEKPSTYAVILAETLAMHSMLENLKNSADPSARAPADAFVIQMEEADRLAPSSGTRNMLRYLLCYRIGETLAQSDASFGEFWRPNCRALGASSSLAIAVWQRPAWQSLIAAHPDAARVAQMLRDERERFPGRPRVEDWAVLRALAPDEAESLRPALIEYEPETLSTLIDAKLSPASVAASVELFWLLQAQRKPTEALAEIERLKQLGITPPFSLAE